ncbi:MAG TPA: cytochrome c biogenesis protein CcdA [Candidatus Thermoplasmatota archaeon]|nr:cytochrome c biogenesis protein CcdA [Candidatus Thermoplasmatota archaeon]
MPDPTILLANLALGAFAFFSPCGFPMLPAYVAYYLPRPTGAGPEPFARAALRGLCGGLVAAAGAFGVLLLIGLLAVAIGAPFKQHVEIMELVGGMVLVAMGSLMLAGRAPSFAVGLRPSQARSVASLAGFGALYAATASACVVPVLIGVLFPAFAAPSLADGVLQIAAYAAGLALLLVIVSVLLATSQDRLVRAMRRIVPHVEKVTGTILVAAGLYLVWYWSAVTYGIPAPPSIALP